MGMEMRSGKGKGMLAANRLARSQSLILIDSSFPRDGIIFPHIALHALLTIDIDPNVAIVQLSFLQCIDIAPVQCIIAS